MNAEFSQDRPSRNIGSALMHKCSHRISRTWTSTSGESSSRSIASICSGECFKPHAHLLPVQPQIQTQLSHIPAKIQQLDMHPDTPCVYEAYVVNIISSRLFDYNVYTGVDGMKLKKDIVITFRTDARPSRNSTK